MFFCSSHRLFGYSNSHFPLFHLSLLASLGPSEYFPRRGPPFLLLISVSFVSCISFEHMFECFWWFLMDDDFFRPRRRRRSEWRSSNKFAICDILLHWNMGILMNAPRTGIAMKKWTRGDVRKARPRFRFRCSCFVLSQLAWISLLRRFSFSRYNRSSITIYSIDKAYRRASRFFIHRRSPSAGFGALRRSNRANGAIASSI